MSTLRPNLTRFAWLSVAAALLTIGLKGTAYFLTGSVGLLSDALESLVNLVAAIGALIALTIAQQPPDEEHAYGHEKAEYFSSGFEGGLIVLAAASIVAVAIPRLLHPGALGAVGLGLGLSTVGSLINAAVAWRLLRAGKDHRSITLEADGRHLLTDVWTSVGVLLGVAAVAISGWERLDPIIALIVAANITWTGLRLVQRSALGLLDTALPANERAAVQAVLQRYEQEDHIRTHALRTRQAGSRAFVSVHVLVPGWWTVHRGHTLLEAIEGGIRAAVPGVTVFTHLESVDDPESWADTALDRADTGT